MLCLNFAEELDYMFVEPAFNNIGHKGWIEVICGPMFSGKTEELIRRLKRSSIAGQKVAIFKPSVDKRYSEDEVVSHDKNNIKSIVVERPIEIIENIGRAKVIGIDEGQFFDESLVAVVQQLAENNKRVIIAGLDMTFSGEPFSPVPELLAIAEYITKVHAICVQCGSLATHSFRLIEADSKVVLGEMESYEPRCRKCFRDGMTERKYR